jgi:CheY-specific phosphatase CheX
MITVISCVVHLMGLCGCTSGVVIISLSFQSAKNGLTLDNLELHALDFIVKEAVQRHDEEQRVMGERDEL